MYIYLAEIKFLPITDCGVDSEKAVLHCATDPDSETSSTEKVTIKFCTVLILPPGDCCVLWRVLFR